MSRFAPHLAALMIAAILAAPSIADPSLVQQPIDALLADLGDADFEARERATTQLMLRTDLTEDALTEALRQSTSPEAHHRLVRVALHRFYRDYRVDDLPAPEADSASLGVDLRVPPNRVVRPHQHPQLTSPALLVTRTLPGFPAFAHLRPGDLIFAIDANRFGDDFDQNMLIEVIQQYKPQQSMTLSVLRNGQAIDITLQLDSLHRLRSVHQQPLPDSEDSAHYAPFQRHLRTLLGDAIDARPGQSTIQVNVPGAPERPTSSPEADAADPHRAVIEGHILRLQREGRVKIEIRGGAGRNIRVIERQIELVPDVPPIDEDEE